jgi:hypothetical protein
MLLMVKKKIENILLFLTEEAAEFQTGWGGTQSCIGLGGAW